MLFSGCVSFLALERTDLRGWVGRCSLIKVNRTMLLPECRRSSMSFAIEDGGRTAGCAPGWLLFDKQIDKIVNIQAYCMSS
jgi:hypothetical protein